MDPTLIVPNILSITLFAVAFFISARAFYLYVQSRSRRLFILGLSMGIVSLTAAAGYAGDNIPTLTINVDWFNYIGQTVSFVFILLSFLSSSDVYLRGLIRWHIAASVLLLLLLLVTADFPNAEVTKPFLSGSRGVICFVIFFYYALAFMTKETRFSLFMAGAFLLLSFGYLIIIPKYGMAGGSPKDLLDHFGDITRIIGLGALLTAVSFG